MRAINHAITGAVIGLTIAVPVIAVPAALASHFALDALPHFGEPEDVMPTNGRAFKALLFADAILCFALVGVLAVWRPENWLLAAVCAFVATSPDFMSIRKFIAAHKNKKAEPRYWITKFAKRIQWGERSWGWIIEVAWFFTMATILAAYAV